jgi:hypothetical protein
VPIEVVYTSSPACNRWHLRAPAFFRSRFYSRISAVLPIAQHGRPELAQVLWQFRRQGTKRIRLIISSKAATGLSWSAIRGSVPSLSGIFVATFAAQDVIQFDHMRQVLVGKMFRRGVLRITSQAQVIELLAHFLRACNRPIEVRRLELHTFVPHFAQSLEPAH